MNEKVRMHYNRLLNRVEDLTHDIELLEGQAVYEGRRGNLKLYSNKQKYLTTLNTMLNNSFEAEIAASCARESKIIPAVPTVGDYGTTINMPLQIHVTNYRPDLEPWITSKAKAAASVTLAELRGDLEIAKTAFDNYRRAVEQGIAMPPQEQED